MRRRVVVGDAESSFSLGNQCCRPAPSGLSVPLTVGGAGSAAQGDMPVRFKVRPGARRRVEGTPRGGMRDASVPCRASWPEPVQGGGCSGPWPSAEVRVGESSMGA